MKTRQGVWPHKIELRKDPYLVYYQCCDVMDMCLETTMCWMCSDYGGCSVMDIPRYYPELKEDVYDVYNPGKSTARMAFSRLARGQEEWRP